MNLIELYTGTTQDFSILGRENTWEFPTCVLDPKLQNGKKLPNWEFRTRHGQYLENPLAMQAKLDWI